MYFADFVTSITKLLKVLLLTYMSVAGTMLKTPNMSNKISLANHIYPTTLP